MKAWVGAHCKLAAAGLMRHNHDTRRLQEEHLPPGGPTTGLAQQKHLTAARQQKQVNLRVDESAERSWAARSVLIMRLNVW